MRFFCLYLYMSFLNIGHSMSKPCKVQILVPEGPEPNSMVKDVPAILKNAQEMYFGDDLVMKIKWNQTLKIIVDYEDSIIELDEQNNTWSYTVQ
jgi:hypothetical protein